MRSARWRSEAAAPVPARIVVADDTLTADEAWRLAGNGVGLLWRGDFQNARQLVQALGRRVDRRPAKPGARPGENPGATPRTDVRGAGEAFSRHRDAQAKRARLLGSVLIPLDADYSIPLRRAPDMKQACAEAWGPAAEGDGPSLISLRELLGVVGAHEWRKKGVEFPILGNAPNNRIHPWYGVFSPVRGEYVQLVGKQKLPAALGEQSLAFDIGTGTGVLAALLARRGIKRVIATDLDERALGCARENIERLGVGKRVKVEQADLFPDGSAPLIVCNPPWVPARANSPVEHAIYDEGSRMLRGFLAGLAAHLSPGGEGWLILSDLAEYLGLRTREELLAWIDGGGLRVLDRTDVKPQHPKAADAADPLHAARANELTSLWRLALK
ncbi:MAG: class I SAM-dependent methyltransferase [Comamonadaceae bacterium]|nr:MAG: class I SAM-dependent methyltransferase [Comamonadaceae bacterium]